MKTKESVGIDVSKKTIDVALYISNLHHQFENNTKGYKSMLAWVKRQTHLSKGEFIICFEHTGVYSLPLAVWLNGQKIEFCMEPALQIKRSLGLVRGKNDKVDASRIAAYAWQRKDKLKSFILPSPSILQLQKLLSFRTKLVAQRAGYLATQKEYKAMLKRKDYEVIFSTQEKMILYISKQIKAIEVNILDMLKQDEELRRIYNLLISIPGVGLILCCHFIVNTNCFSSITDSRKFACYAGIAPFEKQSGISLHGRAKVSHFANKRIKSLLHLAASSAVMADPELKKYYAKRVKDGKSKMSTLNIVRNKIVHRVFAVVKRGTPYVKLQKHAA